MPLPLIPQQTIRYRTHLKRALVEAMRQTFEVHEDAKLQDTKVSIEFPQEEAHYPSLVVRFFERSITNAGVGHREYIRGARLTQPDAVTLFKHYIYKGDVEFAIYSLSSYDRDLMADTLVQILGMGDIEGWTNNFFERIYHNSETDYSLFHYINLDTDNIQGFGENQVIAPWMPEDVLVYQTSYRVGVMGEVYSLPPDSDYPLVEGVDVFPWIEGIEPQPEGSEDPAPWMDAADG